jgi:hypothetical protein
MSEGGDELPKQHVADGWLHDAVLSKRITFDA